MTVTALDSYERDVVWTAAGELELVFLGHGSLLFLFGGKTIYVDPFGRVADYPALPKADLVLITHEHHDHLDPEALASIRTARTAVVLPQVCAEQVEGGIVIRNGQAKTVAGLQVEAVPAYNLVHKREDGVFFHPPGVGNGYILTLSDKRVYVAGDTENIPEMKRLRGIDIAFLPMNLPYTMTPEMVADAAKAFRPKVLYPYHFGSTDTSRLVALLGDEGGIEVRVRELA
jgi:L-ascorbate metabolism protein UlaG (beta-lactamase superfamily)